MFPSSLAETWERLYGRFRCITPANPCDFQLTVQALNDEQYSLCINDAVQHVKRSDAMLYLQDFVQNRVLTAVRSHLLWPAALWAVGGRGIMILGESGMGKTTLSLAHNLSGGQVLSDEIAAWKPEEALMHGFPRALAVRPDSLIRLGDRRLHARVMLDEEIALIPLPDDSTQPPFPLAALCALHRPHDRKVSQSNPVFEEIAASEATEIALATLINAQTWMDQVGASRLKAMVQSAVGRVRCIRCAPGSIAQTRAAIERLAA